ncbi:hypothetical protein GUITHDRAFT_118372 [Guillardia theta CCMP2712]|uniref:RWP-RK domain-containing protein n=1 Tax=Guillardia theta (strain CCMP2712) TaxID=905079 RepID=L1II17_GUITC|nr:hypothetical protein GUITHDRAFT_118372 [Guillardia theta CCMP2712]EKX35455.1 hypothetical protein GUITHDRAFT_118372 [Guillardia theta CCMP2712]|eukprot:XP_005822435.1 hypothetical protein GUITHDRAFT_118372 [Guillardia theta CCMP2712]
MHMRQEEAAKKLGISVTALRSASKKLGIHKWPYSRSSGDDSSHEVAESDSGGPSTSAPSSMNAAPSIFTPAMTILSPAASQDSASYHQPMAVCDWPSTTADVDSPSVSEVNHEASYGLHPNLCLDDEGGHLSPRYINWFVQMSDGESEEFSFYLRQEASMMT